jgi:hypothetical protein
MRRFGYITRHRMVKDPVGESSLQPYQQRVEIVAEDASHFVVRPTGFSYLVGAEKVPRSNFVPEVKP